MVDPDRHPDTVRCIEARNRLNEILYGKGALIDSLEESVESVARRITYNNKEYLRERFMQDVSFLLDDLAEAVACKTYNGWVRGKTPDQLKQEILDKLQGTP